MAVKAPGSFAAFALPLVVLACARGSAPPATPAAANDTASGGTRDAPAIDAGSGSVTLAVEDASAPPVKLEPLPTTHESAPDAGHTKSPPHREAGRTPNDVQKAVIAVRDQARACYDMGAKDHPGVEGDLVMRFTIDPKGAVTEIAADPAKSAIADAATIACVTGVLKTLSFPPSPGGFETHANYPFTFRAHRH